MSLFAMYRSALALILALCFLSDGRSGPAPLLTIREFGFSLNPNAQGDFHALFIYTVYNGAVVDALPMRTEPYVLQMAGLQESRANQDGADLFSRFGINQCGAWMEEDVVHTNLQCLAVLQLWKLRYRKEMVDGQGKGWASEEFTPSARQQVLLQLYRPPQFEDWHGPYFGEGAFRLLRDMQDPEWVQLYQIGG